MTITSTTRKAGPYLGNGVTTAFSFDFKVFKKEDVTVMYTDANGVDSVLTLDSDYSVVLNADQDNNPGGTITYPRVGSPLAVLNDEQKLTFTGGLAYTQPTDIPNLSPFFPQVVEDALDRAEIQIQQIKEISDRSVKVGVSDDPLAPLPGNQARANMYLGFDAIGGLTLLPAPSSVGAGDRIPFTLTSGVDFQPNDTQVVLPRAPGVPGNIEVHYDGVPQEFGEWSLNGQILVFASPIPNYVSEIWGYIGTTLSTEVPPPNSISDANVTASAGIQSTKLSYNLGVTGSVPRTVYATLRDEVSVFDFLTQAQADDVTSGAWTLDVTAGIQKAIDYASITGKVLHVPAGLYKIVPATAVTSEAGAETVAFVMKSNMHIEAERGAVFKLADNQSTDAAPKALEMFFTNQVLNKVSLRRLSMDMNGANNLISPGRGSGTYDVSKNMAMICVSGTPGGVAARINDMLVEECSFLNTSGVCCIVAAQTNTIGATLGARWTVKNNLFYNNGTDTSDHTSVFAWADDFLTDGNVFWQSTPYATVGKAGGVTAFEVHGSNHRFVNNYVQNYFRGMWVGPNYTATLDNTLISGNVFVVNFYGVDFFRFAANQTTSRNTLITGNIFNVDDTTFAGAPDQKAVINVSPSYSVGDVKVIGNIALKTGTGVSSVFTTVAPGTNANNPIDRVSVTGNKATGFCFGVGAFCNGTNGIGFLNIEGNTWTDFKPAGVTAVSAGSFINGSTTGVSSLAVGTNYAIDTNPAGLFHYGYYVQGTVTDFFLGPQFYKGLAVSNYFENASNITKRKGFFENISFTPTIMAGASTMSLGNGTLTATYSLNNDLVEVDVKLTVGSTTSFGAGGNITISMPFTAEGNGKTYMGNWRIFDGSIFAQGVAAVDGTTNTMSMSVNSGGLVSSSAPVSLSTGRVVSNQIIYRKAA